LLGKEATKPSTNLEAWSLGHVIRDSVNLVTLKQMLRIHFKMVKTKMYVKGLCPDLVSTKPSGCIGRPQ
jgi:hypothetical protein